MAHYAFLDENNVVTDVITGGEGGDLHWELHYTALTGKECKRTSYGTTGGEHPEGRPFRKNFAAVGYTYNPKLDAFIPPKPHEGWLLNKKTCLWIPPVPYPTDGGFHVWYEPEQRWVDQQDFCEVP